MNCFSSSVYSGQAIGTSLGPSAGFLRRKDKLIQLFGCSKVTHAVADLGFPRGGCANPRGGANLLFDQFFLKTA